MGYFCGPVYHSSTLCQVGNIIYSNSGNKEMCVAPVTSTNVDGRSLTVRAGDTTTNTTLSTGCNGGHMYTCGACGAPAAADSRRGGSGGNLYLYAGGGGNGTAAEACGGYGGQVYICGGTCGASGGGCTGSAGIQGCVHLRSRINHVCATYCNCLYAGTANRIYVGSELGYYQSTSTVYLYYNGSGKFCTVTNGACIVGCGFATDFVASSDCRLKDCIEPITSALSKVDCLCGVCYELCEDGTKDMGLIAQDVEKVEPRLVTRTPVTKTDDDVEQVNDFGIKDEKLGLKYDKMAGLFVEAIKELKKQNNCLQLQINSLRKNLK